MPKESPPGRDYGLKKLRAVAKTAARKWPGLAPRGGHRWTPEDLDRGVSLLFGITRTRAFRREFPDGLDGGRSRGYLLSALRNDLVQGRKRFSRMILLDNSTLDRLTSGKVREARLASEDARCLACRFLGRCTAAEAAELDRQRRGIGLGPASRKADTRGQPSRSTRARLWAGVSEALLAFADVEGLKGGERCDFLAALGVKLAGGGQESGGFRRILTPRGTLDTPSL
jgi:hypothetical protein